MNIIQQIREGKLAIYNDVEPGQMRLILQYCLPEYNAVFSGSADYYYAYYYAADCLFWDCHYISEETTPNFQTSMIINASELIEYISAITPTHYGGEDNPYEVIKVIDAWGLDFYLGNVVKYVARAGKKGDAKEDLQKAIKYLEMKIKKL